MAERYEGEEQLLSEAVGRVFHLRPRHTGTHRKPQFQINIPAAIARLMLKKSEAWRWRLTDDGVLLEPATDDQNELPRGRGTRNGRHDRVRTRLRARGAWSAPPRVRRSGERAADACR
jgi:hypothetical protein